jgi:hypothetical protein
MSKDPKVFAKNFLAKSYDFPDSQIIIDAKDQQAAEEGTPKKFLNKLASQIIKGKTVHKIVLQKGSLTLANKDSGLYTGFFSDENGQIVEKFDAHTLELIAKNLIVKKYATDHDIYGEDEDLKDDVLTPSQAPATVRIKVGDIEIEIRKAIKNFVDDFRQSRGEDSEVMKKAVKSWRRNQKFTQFESDIEAAQAILADWEIHKESFGQSLFAIRQLMRK